MLQAMGQSWFSFLPSVGCFFAPSSAFVGTSGMSLAALTWQHTLLFVPFVTKLL